MTVTVADILGMVVVVAVSLALVWAGLVWGGWL